MSEEDSSAADNNQTPTALNFTALNFARAYYAGALLAARHWPHDPQRQQQAEEAWKDYALAAGKNGQKSRLETPPEAQ